MCCFSQKVTSVSSTNIFARTAPEDRQFLVYSMSIKAAKDLAMILPLPVKQPAGERDVQFIDLKSYPGFFVDLEKGFPQPPAPGGHGRGSLRGESAAPKTLKVQQVGNFEASFVPALSNFSRLDERFRLPERTCTELPDYQTYGFAVFKLKPGVMTVHPMAFSFPRRNPQSLFFPTVDIHDGKVHAEAHFDHSLYCQPSEEGRPEVMK